MNLLALIQDIIMLARCERRQYNPLSDRGPVDPTAGRDGDVAVSEDRVRGVVVYPGGEEMDEFQAGGY